MLRTISLFPIRLCLAAAAALSFLACHGDDEASGRVVYIAGTTYSSGGNPSAKLYKNGFSQQLSQSRYSGANSVFASGSDVYVAGWEGTTFTEQAVLWKNGQALSLSSGRPWIARALSVVVSGGKVAVGGYEVPSDTQPERAMVWVNGVGHNLGNGRVSSVSVSREGDVYAVGEDSRWPNRAVLWKNSSPQPLPADEPFSYAYSVFISDGDVYVAGYEFSLLRPETAVLWKNGEIVHRLDSQYSEFRDVFVSGDDIYLAGGEADWRVTRASTWKNFQPQRMQAAHDLSYASSLFVAPGGDVYAVGYEYGTQIPGQGQSLYWPRLWINGVRQDIEGVQLNTIFSFVFVAE